MFSFQLSTCIVQTAHVKRMLYTKKGNCGSLKSNLKGFSNLSRIPIPSASRNKGAIPRRYSVQQRSTLYNNLSCQGWTESWQLMFVENNTTTGNEPQVVRTRKKNNFFFDSACKSIFLRGASLSKIAFFSEVKIAAKNTSYFSLFF